MAAQFVPITENHPQVGQSPYAASKIGADQIALSYWRSFDTPVTVLRPFNTYGPRQSALLSLQLLRKLLRVSVRFALEPYHLPAISISLPIPVQLFKR